MNWLQILQAILALCFVIGLLLLTLWIFKNCERLSLHCKFIRNIKNKQRINIVEKLSLDSKNNLFLIAFDQTEYLLLVGINGNQIIQQNTLGKTKNE